ncbi:MAG: beta-propeller fold lactonase family protein, partial [Promethearchaeia archaeon]
TCKSGNARDWDRPKGTPSLSLETFLVNNGEYEAMQFDDTVNVGLHVTNDIDALGKLGGASVSTRLPRSALSVEAWFTLERDSVVMAGLAAAVQDARACALGWSLTYDRKRDGSEGATAATTTYMFKVSLPHMPGQSTAESPPIFAQLQLATRTELYVWTHIVAAYNSSHLVFYLDGVEAAATQACGHPPCGNIVYSSNQRYGPHGCIPGHTALTIGTVADPHDNYRYPHHGLIRHVRIAAVAVDAQSAGMLYRRLAAVMKSAIAPDFEYWVRAAALEHGQHTSSSPSIDWAYAESQDWVTVRGNFSAHHEYQCTFTYQDLNASSPGHVSCSNSSIGVNCPAGFSDQVTCRTPLWRFGFKGAILAISRRQAQSAGNASVGNLSQGDQNASRPWTRLLQRVCVRESCGYKSPLDRFDGQVPASDWYTAGSRNLLSAALGGGLSRIRMLTPGAIYRVEAANTSTHRLVRVASFMTGMHDAWGTPARNRFLAGGVSGYTHTTRHGQHYLLGATAWDGSSPNSTSGLYHFNESSGRLQLLQEIDSFGARRWLFFDLDGELHAAVANYFGPSQIFRCRGGHGGNGSRTSLLSLDTDTALSLDIRAASSLAAVSVHGVLYILVSTFADGVTPGRRSPSVLYRLRAASHGRAEAHVVQELSVPHAAGVTHFRHAGNLVVVFAVKHDDSPSLMFAARLADFPLPNVTSAENVSAANASFATAQAPLLRCCEKYSAHVPTRLAESVQAVEIMGRQFLLVTADRPTSLPSLLDDSQVSSKLLLFNNSHFIGRADPSTSLQNSGGQLLNLTRNTHLAYVETSASGFLVAGHFRDGSDGARALQILPARVEQVEGLLRPTSVAVSTVDGRFLYVAASGAQSIAVFHRDAESGELRPASVLSPPSESFRSIQRIAMSPDQRHLYATLTHQAALVVMAISATSGSLTVASRVADGDMTDSGMALDCLSGAYGLHVSADGGSVYTASYFDGTLAVFARNSTDGGLEYVDAIRDGERIFPDFEDLPLDEPLRQEPPVRTSSTPRTLPLGS